MFGVRLIVILAVVGGVIAYLADKLGGKIGKKKLTVAGLRPRDTATLLTVIAGVLIAVCTIGVLAVSSESARTALFGMDELERSIKSLQIEKEKAKEDLSHALEDAEEKNATIVELDKKIAASQQARGVAEENLKEARAQYDVAQQDLVSARGEVTSLKEAREKLNEEIANLTDMTAKLRKESETLKRGLAAMRSGQMLYRSGEILFAGVVKGGQSSEDSLKQVDWLLTAANQSILQRMEYEYEEGKPLPEVLLVSRKDHDQLVEAIATSSKNVELLVRVCALTNSVLGEPVVGIFELTQNEKIYRDGDVIYQAALDINGAGHSPDAAFILFLSEVNRRSVERGVLPDPVSGKVGSMQATEMLETVERIRNMGGKVSVTARARGDIYTAGPVLLNVEVERASNGESE